MTKGEVFKVTVEVSNHLKDLTEADAKRILEKMILIAEADASESADGDGCCDNDALLVDSSIFKVI